ncbi:putative flippase GtrA [Novosphingobium kunmingense]|uniref:Putative flippase GtrA n=1 Tax=Novosphingobium kunmingense TaxID=1211806 RepID=A0A2N0H5E2_9SPHN|nr:GtrA family protein [Novosphingobium kunmingense]PKB14171.1 putative flippase GtrA [Novosphingobium kunmingense]
MLRRAADLVLLRYLLASVLALGVDVGTFVTLLHGGVSPTLAATAGYSLGIVAHWLLSSRAVFTEGVAERGPRRTRQKALFVLSALAGLGVTTLIVGGASTAGLDPRLAKIFAIGVSFTLTWLLRKAVIFRAVAPA